MLLYSDCNKMHPLIAEIDALLTEEFVRSRSAAAAKIAAYVLINRSSLDDKQKEWMRQMVSDFVNQCHQEIQQEITSQA